MELKQFVPAEYCAKCDVCCRFLDEETPLAPVGLKLAPYNDRFICQNFDPAKNNCEDYSNRPLDCQIYPFVVMYDKDYKNVLLAVDPKCPYIEKSQIPNLKSQINPKFQMYKKYLFEVSKDIDPEYIARFQDDVQILGKMDAQEREPALRELLTGDKEIFEKYAGLRNRPLSTYSFIANYIWKDLLEYCWAIIDDNFCLFCKTAGGMFMPILPLGKKVSKKTVKGCFEIMAKANKNKDYSRIEEVSGDNLKFFKGLKIKEKGAEYICRQKDLAGLSGDKYKAKRALCNYFEKNYKFEYRKFRKEDMKDCLELFEIWRGSRKGGDYCNALMEDSRLAHERAMRRYEDLGLWGRVLIVDNRISGYTFGYPLDIETFVVLFEITDLKIKGISQYIFRQFSEEASAFKYINLMDDSGLENLKKVKMSYHPVKIERQFCVYA